MMIDLDMPLRAIDLEPELEGDMPDEMWQALRNDRDLMNKALHLAVKETKEGIKERLLHIITAEH